LPEAGLSRKSHDLTAQPLLADFGGAPR